MSSTFVTETTHLNILSVCDAACWVCLCAETPQKVSDVQQLSVDAVFHAVALQVYLKSSTR